MKRIIQAIIAVSLLLVSVCLSDIFTKRNDPSFKFPYKIAEGKLFTITDHTNFTWDKMEVYSAAFLVDGFPEKYKKIQDKNPNFFIFNDIPKVIIFYLDGEIVYAAEYSDIKISYPNGGDSTVWMLEFTNDNAVFLSVKDDRWQYKLVPYTK